MGQGGMAEKGKRWEKGGDGIGKGESGDGDRGMSEEWVGKGGEEKRKGW